MGANDAADSVPDAPSPTNIKVALRLVEPLRQLIRPKVYGIDNVSERRALLVGNHTVLGVLDLPLVCAELWERGRIVRALGDHAQFKVPGWRDMLKILGVVEGSRANCAELMRRGELIMVFPGGGREVAKHKGERYTLVWKNRMGFARMAIQYGYPIIPFASVGADDAVDIVMNPDNPLLTPERLFVERVLGSPDSWPLWRGIGPTPIPRPERQYYWFGEPIDTTAVSGRHDDDAAVRKVRDRTKAAVEHGMQVMLEERQHDKNRSLVGRLLEREHRADPVAKHR
ncbi:MAG TPA: lysophospholipid acyltransferase family protein [Mycobacterium sp.]|nr:lysophospholipid acyltransferase family protein [Mycobacterium sp.]